MKIIIIGNSAAGLSALDSFRKYDKTSKVTLISKEPGPAYSRVLLPYYLRKKLTLNKLFLNDKSYYQKLKAETYFGYEVTKINEVGRYIELDNGELLSYDKLLIATGAHPVKPPIRGLEGRGVFHMWTLNDALSLEPYYKEGKRVLILGSGFVSLQAAWSAVKCGMKVSIYELAPRIMPQVLDEKGANVLEKQIYSNGVDLKVNTCTERIERNADNTLTAFAQGLEPQTFDLIIVGTGVCPNIAFLINSSLDIERGLLVNNKMETNIPGIYAAGDVVQGPTAFGDEHVIHALWPTAVEEGKVAGANMAGEDIIYTGSLNMNVTEMFGITVASMGRFMGEVNDTVEEYGCPQNGHYIKIVYSGGIPIGGIVIGNSEDVELLGILRPLIRYKKSVVKTANLRINTLLSQSNRSYAK